MDYKVSDKAKYIYKILCETEKLYGYMLKRANITDSEYVLFFSVLEMGEGCSQKDIAENTHISTKTLNSTVKKLEQSGLIKLKPGKYPNMHIYLTPKGEKYAKEKVLPVTNSIDNFLEDIPEKDFSHFSSVVNRYLNMFSGLVDVGIKNNLFKKEQ